MTKEDPAMAWRPSRFFLAIPGGDPREAWGYEGRGVIMRHAGWRTPRSETMWTLYHAGSGSAVARFTGTVSTVMPVASEIAGCSDWTLFDLPEGWRQTDPELPAKVGAILNAHPEARPGTEFVAPKISDDDARAVMRAAEDAAHE